MRASIPHNDAPVVDHKGDEGDDQCDVRPADRIEAGKDVANEEEGDPWSTEAVPAATAA